MSDTDQHSSLSPSSFETHLKSSTWESSDLAQKC